MSRSNRGSTSKEKDKECLKDTGDVWTCEGCKKEFRDDNSRILECERCERHYCVKCIKLTDDVYDILTTRKDFHWYCGGCESKVLQCIQLEREVDKKLTEFMTNVDYRIKTVEGNMSKKLAELEDKLYGKLKDYVTHATADDGLQKVANKVNQDVLMMKEDMKNLVVTIGSVKGEIKEEIEEVKATSFADIMKEEMQKNLENMASEIKTVKTNLDETKENVDEQRDKERRRNNIIIYNIPESSAERADGRMKEDTSFCLRMFNDVLQAGISDEDLVHVFRLGKYIENATLPRPLLIQMASYTQKNLIMQSLYKLKHAELQFKNVVVTHDMTVAERAECKRMVTEAKDKEAEDQSGDYIYRVRGLPGKMQIVKIRKPR